MFIYRLTKNSYIPDLSKIISYHEGINKEHNVQMVVINAYAVGNQLAMVVVAQAAAAACRTVVHARQFENLALLAVAKLRSCYGRHA